MIYFVFFFKYGSKFKGSKVQGSKVQRFRSLSEVEAQMFIYSIAQISLAFMLHDLYPVIIVLEPGI